MISPSPKTYKINYAKAACSKLNQATPHVDRQASINNYFSSVASDWERIYKEVTLHGCIHQYRKAIALQWIEQLHLPRTAHLLEVGCGAGLATVALAMRGYRVDALDSVPAMIDLTRKRVAETGTADRVRIIFADVRQLPMPANSFDLVFALGVVPWLDDPPAAIREIARVTRPGGYVLVNAENRLHLEEALDPRRAPILEPIRRRLAPALYAMKLLPPRPPCPQLPRTQRHSRREFDSILLDAGLDKLRGLMFGFGPFTLLGKKFLSESMGIKVNRLLQAAANRNLPIVSSHGAHYLVMSRKRA